MKNADIETLNRNRDAMIELMDRFMDGEATPDSCGQVGHLGLSIAHTISIKHKIKRHEK